MDFDPLYFRQDLRHPTYDYRDPGVYFITVCTKDRRLLFGDVVGNDMMLNGLGRRVEASWRELPARFPNLSLQHPFVVMPNHVHGILQVEDRGPELRRHLGAFVAAFKGAATRRIQELCRGLVVWQTNYYEHVIREEKDLLTIGQYILDNPRLWNEDTHNPRAVGKDALEKHLREAGKKGSLPK
jgi:putative transposase